MKFFRLFAIGISALLISCKSKSVKDPLILDTTHAVTSGDTLKKFNDVKIALLDARNEKAELLLGKPDVKGQVMMRLSYYMVYFNKVKDNGETKHLILLIDGRNGITDASPIYKMVAIRDGETIERAGNFAQWLRVSTKGLTSNSTVFSYGKGDVSWLDVDITNSGQITPSNGIIGDKKSITTLNDLPVPSQAIKDSTVKKYIVTGLSAREIYIWYAEHYHAKIVNNNDGEHKYLGMPYYSPDDTCIMLKLTGYIDGSIQLEFSFECD